MPWDADDSTWNGRRTLVVFGLSVALTGWLFTASNCAQAEAADQKAEPMIDRETPLREEADAVRVLYDSY